VLQNFTAEELPWVRAVLDGIAEAAPLLVADDTAGFATKVALVANPPAPKPPRPPKFPAKPEGKPEE
jgi:peptidyl-tRNA hydrolase, PTH1 family